METTELRYFFSVARFENLHRASEILRVSPSALSKAVSRLEHELGVKLFSREGRNIQLTDQGRWLKRRASEILHLEESARAEIVGAKGSLQVRIAGPEVLLGRFGLELSDVILRSHPQSVFQFQAANDQSAIRQVMEGETHLGLVTSVPAQTLHSKVLGSSTFQTCLAPGHPLYQAAKARREVSIEKVLAHSFVAPSYALLGQVRQKQSFDGWRDDQFQRKIGYVVSSLKTIEEIVRSGRALAYLPDYLIESFGFQVLRVVGCPYSCSQKLYLIARDPKQAGWMNQLF